MLRYDCPPPVLKHERSQEDASEQNSQFAKPQRGPSPPMHKDNMINQLKANTGRTVKYSDGEESSDEDWGTVPA